MESLLFPFVFETSNNVRVLVSVYFRSKYLWKAFFFHLVFWQEITESLLFLFIYMAGNYYEASLSIDSCSMYLWTMSSFYLVL